MRNSIIDFEEAKNFQFRDLVPISEDVQVVQSDISDPLQSLLAKVSTHISVGSDPVTGQRRERVRNKERQQTTNLKPPTGSEVLVRNTILGWNSRSQPLSNLAFNVSGFDFPEFVKFDS